jgi:GT2 family glycosyltransferase
LGRVTVIVVTYNSADTIERCLASLPEDAEVIVVDNASRDGTADFVERRFPSATVIRNERNLGFGVANNVGLSLAHGEFALLLNPDACAGESESVAKLGDFLSDAPDAVACGGRLELPNGNPHESACRRLSLWAVFCEQTYLEKPFPFYWVSLRHLRKSSEPVQVAQVMGACLMMRRIAGVFVRFDERFFLYCEDTDLCRRLEEHGSIWYVPEARFVHELGSSSTSDRWRAVAFYNRGKELYFAIHGGPFAAAAAFLLDRMGALLRLVLWGVASTVTLFCVSGFRRRAGTFLKVLFAPLNPYNTASRV